MCSRSPRSEVGARQRWVPSRLALLALIVLALGPLLDRFPLHALQLVIGVLLLLFGMRWLRKAILRAAGVIPLHDEANSLRDARRKSCAIKRVTRSATRLAGRACELQGGRARRAGSRVHRHRRWRRTRSPWCCEPWRPRGLFGRGRGRLLLHRPLEQVPENTLKFAVGVMLSAFGIFWTGEGLGVPWPGEDLAILSVCGPISDRRACRCHSHPSL